MDEIAASLDPINQTAGPQFSGPQYIIRSPVPDLETVRDLLASPPVTSSTIIHGDELTNGTSIASELPSDSATISFSIDNTSAMHINRETVFPAIDGAEITVNTHLAPMVSIPVKILDTVIPNYRNGLASHHHSDS